MRSEKLKKNFSSPHWLQHINNAYVEFSFIGRVTRDPSYPRQYVRMPLTHSLLVDRQVGMSGYSHITVWYLLALLVNRQDLFTCVVILIIAAWYLLLASLVDRQDLFTCMDTLIIATWYLLLTSLVDLVGSFHVYGYSCYFCMVSSSHIVG